jgi:hypothetical protein
MDHERDTTAQDADEQEIAIRVVLADLFAQFLDAFLESPFVN